MSLSATASATRPSPASPRATCSAISPVLTALVAAVAGAVGIEWLRSRHRTAGDQALALLFYTGLAAGVVIASSPGAFNADLFAFLFGSILTVTREDLLSSRCSAAGLAVDRRFSTARWPAVVLDEEGAKVGRRAGRAR